ncbi:hypothetical protein GCM10023321_73820 [Pseudonocardia eucalypti]|uniref:DUF3040 domain-containing protein n=1 Tax=Pseudonocardia eucalypti TaxID=648755 RepID=A0ABP9R8E2_9PSEU|nr:hypothetical protein [Pseudonocardia eucalypti]
MLSERERQVLGEIERTVTASDPALASLLGASRPPRAFNWNRIAYDAVTVLAVLSAMLCIALGAFGAGMVATLFAMVVLSVRRLRFPKNPVPRPR